MLGVKGGNILMMVKMCSTVDELGHHTFGNHSHRTVKATGSLLSSVLMLKLVQKQDMAETKKEQNWKLIISIMF